MDVILFGWCAGAATACARAVASAGDRVVLAVSGPAAQRGALDETCDEIGAPLLRTAETEAAELQARVAALGADLLLVAGWPRRIARPLLHAPRLGAVNVHPSLLPRHRAREPIFWAVLSGDRESGVTLHRMTEHIDEGPVLLQRRVAVPARSTSVTLGERLDVLAAELTQALCGMARAGSLPEGTPQRGEPTRFPPLAPEHGALCWSEPAQALDRRVRACAGTLEARASHAGMKVVVLEALPERSSIGTRGLRPLALPAEGKSPFSAALRTSTAAVPGSLLEVRNDALVIAAGEGSALAVVSFGFLGRRVTAAELAATLGLRAGARFDDG